MAVILVLDHFGTRHNFGAPRPKWTYSWSDIQARHTNISTYIASEAMQLVNVGQAWASRNNTFVSWYCLLATGHTPDPVPGEDPSERLAQLGKTEIPLTLSNRQKVSSEDEEQDVKGIFVRTKRMVVEILNAQPSDNLTEVLNTPATPEQEEAHQQRQKKKEEAAETEKVEKDGLKRSQSLVGDSRSVWLLCCLCDCVCDCVCVVCCFGGEL